MHRVTFYNMIDTSLNMLNKNIFRNFNVNQMLNRNTKSVSGVQPVWYPYRYLKYISTVAAADFVSFRLRFSKFNCGTSVLWLADIISVNARGHICVQRSRGTHGYWWDIPMEHLSSMFVYIGNSQGFKSFKA